MILHVDHFENPDNLASHQKRQSDDRAGFKAGDMVHFPAEMLVLIYFLNDSGPFGLGHVASNPFPHLETQSLQKFVVYPHTHGKIKFLSFTIHQEEGPVSSGDEGLDALQNRGKQSLHVISAYQGLGELDTGQEPLHLACFRNEFQKISFCQWFQPGVPLTFGRAL